MSKRAIILSGGGAKGAWGVGVVKALMEEGQSYDIAIGTSTGALQAPFVLANEIAALESGYTSVNQDDIFDKSKNPFKSDGGIKTANVLWRLINGKSTLGETEKLKEKIAEMVTNDMLNSIRAENKLLGASVANLSLGYGQVKTLDDYSNDDMRDWIWASANNPIFMSDLLYTEDGVTQSYADGGVTNYANVEYVVDYQNDNLEAIDVIFHNTRDVIRPDYDINAKFLKRLLRVLDMFSADVNKNDLINAQLKIKPKSDVDLNIYYMRDLDITTITGPSRNSLLFDQQRMQTGLMRGYVQTKNGQVDVERCLLKCDTGRIIPKEELNA